MNPRTTIYHCSIKCSNENDIRKENERGDRLIDDLSAETKEVFYKRRDNEGCYKEKPVTKLVMTK